MSRIIKLTIIILSIVGIMEGQKRQWAISLSNGQTLSNVTVESLYHDSVGIMRDGEMVWHPVSVITGVQSETKRPDVLTGVLGGTLLGGGAGLLFSHIINAGEENPTSDKVLFTLLGAGVGGITGYAIGMSGSHYEEYNFNTLTQKEKLATIEFIMMEEGTRTAQEMKRSGNGPSEYRTQQDTNGIHARRIPDVRFGLYAGFSTPVGDFSKRTSGALNGFAIGGDLVYRPFNHDQGSLETDWLTSVALSVNEYSVSKQSGDWITIWPMTGIRLGTNPESPLQLSASLQGGLVIGASPSFRYIAGDGSVKQESATDVAIAYTAGFGVTVVRKYALQAKYLSGEPEYIVENITIKQPTSMFNITIGLLF
ncbi:MAG: hypothetical protein EPO24_15235 [Bacteroidetes bacterium]|nr:MAG: hypothetical protein EPO24_15235 [Bacteroidota bacterium]